MPAAFNEVEDDALSCVWLPLDRSTRIRLMERAVAERKNPLELAVELLKQQLEEDPIIVN